MDPLNSRSLFLGSAVLIVVTQVACTAWLGRQLEAYSPVDPFSELADITEQLASVKTAVDDVQDTADAVQARTGALTDAMGGVSRVCAMR